MDFSKFFDLSKWLEFLNLSAGRLLALAAICGTFLLVARWNWIPPLEPWMIQLAALGLIAGVVLAVVGIGAVLLRLFPLDRWFAGWLQHRHDKRQLEKYIPLMTESERDIIGYLLAKNQKSFTTAMDGGNAVTLISRGIIQRTLRPGQAFGIEDVPMAIPDHLWDVLVRRKAEFPCKNLKGPHPWRQNWLTRV